MNSEILWQYLVGCKMVILIQTMLKIVWFLIKLRRQNQKF